METDAKDAHKGGHYNSEYHKIFYLNGEPNQKEFEILGFLVESGYTEQQIGTYYGVLRGAVGKWKQKHPEFYAVVKANKKICDDGVVRALYERAVGYDVIETKVNVSQGSVMLTDVIKHYPPDVSAQQYWLNNRMPDTWKSVAHVANNNTNKDAPVFDVRGLTDAELAMFDALLAKVQPPPAPL